ncbi:MAG: reverse transcriptase family protein [Planctomycetes bacterium]|nr:reverse transcriptase family protein [Planctomycetota bacterium]
MTEAEEAARRAEAREEARRAARLARAEAARARRARRAPAREVLHAGEGVSARLPDARSDVAALERRGLPVMHDAADLATLLGVDMRMLRWLTYHRDVATVTHYRQFQVPKARGGVRTISAPRPALRAAQQAIRRHVLARLEPTVHAQAFVRGRSTLTNARPHVRAAVLVKVDISDFFGAIDFPRVRGLFEALGYSGMVATLLALLSTEARRLEADLDGEPAWVALGPRALPQGAPTSPELTNQIARRLDARLSGYARTHGWVYTRYADDLAFSSQDGARERVGRLLGVVRAALEGEGFRLNRDKLVVVRRGRQQRVTGIVVNDAPGLPRVALRRFRAAVHRVTRAGFTDTAERARMLGYASYVRMVKPALGERWLRALREVPA